MPALSAENGSAKLYANSQLDNLNTGRSRKWKRQTAKWE